MPACIHTTSHTLSTTHLCGSFDCCSGLLIPPGITDELHIDAIRINGNGSMVSAIASGPNHRRDPRLFVYCSENNSTMVHDFSRDGKVPHVLAWDISEPRVLAVNTQVRVC